MSGRWPPRGKSGRILGTAGEIGTRFCFLFLARVVEGRRGGGDGPLWEDRQVGWGCNGVGWVLLLVVESEVGGCLHNSKRWRVGVLLPTEEINDESFLR